MPCCHVYSGGNSNFRETTHLSVNYRCNTNICEDSKVPAFTQKLMTDISNDWLSFYGSWYDLINAVALSQKTQITGLQERLLEKIPSLYYYYYYYYYYYLLLLKSAFLSLINEVSYFCFLFQFYFKSLIFSH